jgi:integrase
VKLEHDLYPYRRHLRACQFFGRGGREARADKCSCPFHVDGKHAGERVRQSLRTRNRQLAERRLAERIRELDVALAKSQGPGPTESQVASRRTVTDAVERFLSDHGGIGENGKYRGDSEYSTWRKYRGILRRLVGFCEAREIRALEDAHEEALEDFRRSRIVGRVTWKGERQSLVTFFGYCLRRKWITTNPAKELKVVRNLKPNEVVPYTLQEESQILEACARIGGGKYNRSGARYEQLRARGMIMLLRHTALRISDVSTLRKDAVSWDQSGSTWRVFLHTQKTGEPVFLPIPDSLKLILDALPPPRNAAQDCPYYFWNGQASRRAVVGIAERTLSAVFRKSGVKDAHAHRFRHTLATRLLEQGATFELVADILANEQPRRGPEALRQVVQGPAGQHRPGHEGPFPDHGGYNSSHTGVTRKNGSRKLMKLKEVLWCGEGDLNLKAPLGMCNLLIFNRARTGRKAQNAHLGHILGTVHTNGFVRCDPPRGFCRS